MKKLFISALALVAVVCIGCTKDDSASSTYINVNFEVVEKPAFDNGTRAVKSTWAEGDQILVTFSKSGRGWVNCANGANTLKLTKTASGWTADVSAITDIAVLNGSNYFAVHHPGAMTLGTKSGNDVMLTGYKGGEYMFAEGTYTVDGSTIELTPITMERPEELSQFSVKDLTIEDGDNWQLAMYAYIDEALYVDQYVKGLMSGKIKVRQNESAASVANSVNAIADGIQNGNDVSFCFMGLKYSEYEGTNICYQLHKSGPGGSVSYFYNTTTMTLEDLSGKALLFPSLESGKWKLSNLELTW